MNNYINGKNKVFVTGKLKFIVMFSHVFMYNSLPRFLDQFVSLLSTLCNERDHATLMALTKRKLNFSDLVEVEYVSHVTPYATQFISKQLQHRHKVKILLEIGSEFDVLHPKVI